MYFFQNIRFISVLCIFLFTDHAHCDSSPLNTREIGSSNKNPEIGVNNNTTLSGDAQKVPSALYQNASSTQVALEGGGIIPPTAETHNGRKNALEHQVTKTLVNETNKLILTQPHDIKPVHESVISTLDIAPQQDDEKQSVPKKGVSFHDLDSQNKSYSSNITDNSKLNVSKSTTPTSSIVYKKVTHIVSNHSSSTNTTVIHKKPLVTESDSDYINNISKSNEEGSKETISIDQIDPLIIDSKSKRSDYIVPIVAVILSVPLVAIVTSILYKRGTDWWQHRNYKRMDFLIEGMYHN